MRIVHRIALGLALTVSGLSLGNVLTNTINTLCRGHALSVRSKSLHEHSDKAANTKHLFVIVPGTWADHNTGWSSPNSPFFQAVERSAAAIGGRVITFNWSFGFSHKDRALWAQELALVMKSLMIPFFDNIHFITHSHGTNLVNKASEILAEDPACWRTITTVYALATPVDMEVYPPNEQVIQRMYHLTSWNDPAPTRLGYKRFYPPCDWIANLTLTIDGEEPTHLEIHDPVVGHWIPQLDTFLRSHSAFTCNTIGNLDIKKNFYLMPNYTIDTNHAAREEEEQSIHPVKHYGRIIEQAYSVAKEQLQQNSFFKRVATLFRKSTPTDEQQRELVEAA